MDLQALGLTLRLAALTTVLLLGLSTPFALWLAGGSSWPRRLLGALAMLPLVLPPTVLGFYLLEGFGPRTTLGRGLIALLGHPLAFSFGGLLAGSMVYSFPFALAPLLAAFAELDPILPGTARTLGASPWQVFHRITLPLTRKAFFAAGILTFCHTVGEFGVVLMLGGDIPGSTRTLSIALFDQVEDANYLGANHTALLLVAFSFFTLVALQLRPHRRAVHPLP